MKQKNSMNLRKALSALAFFSLILSAFFSCRSTQNAFQIRERETEIAITVEGIKNSGGFLLLALYHNEENFNSNANPAFAVKQKITENTIRITLRGRFSPGIYAAAAFHDEDMDGKLKTNPMGMPMEGFAFSGIPDFSRGRPGWDKTSFSVNSEKHSETMKMNYLF